MVRSHVHSGWSAATQVKVVSPEIFLLAMGQGVVCPEASIVAGGMRRVCNDVPGSQTAAQLSSSAEGCQRYDYVQIGQPHYRGGHSTLLRYCIPRLDDEVPASAYPRQQSASADPGGSSRPVTWNRARWYARKMALRRAAISAPYWPTSSYTLCTGLVVCQTSPTRPSWTMLSGALCG